jgi:hypothetical protein
MCPGSVVDGDINVFAETCELNDDGSHTCIGCAGGYSGNNCEICVEPYYGMPENATVR